MIWVVVGQCEQKERQPMMRRFKIERDSNENTHVTINRRAEAGLHGLRSRVGIICTYPSKQADPR